MFKATVRFAILVLAFAVVTPAIAGEGRIPIWKYPTTISAPGKYIVTRDIRGNGAPVIDIQAHQVDLDINGFTLEETSGGFPVIEITGDLVDVVIRNGILVGGRESIERNAAAAQTGDRVVIEDIQTMRASSSSIHLWSINEVVIRRVNVVLPLSHGIWLERVDGFTNGMIEHCAIRLGEESMDGIHVDRASAFAVRHNRIETPSFNGVHLMDSYAVLVAENSISDADGIGIHFENTKGSKIYNNVVSRGETHGIRLDPGSSENLLMENTVRESGWAGSPNPGVGGGHGFLIEGPVNFLEGNIAMRNDACGFLFLGQDNAFGRNMARRNDPALVGWCGPACAGLPTPDYCDGAGGSNHSRLNNMAAGAAPF